MADLKTVFRQKLEGDATLTTLLTGGIYDSSELSREGITPGNLSAIFAADEITILPFAAVTWHEANPGEVLVPNAEMRFCEVYVYQFRRYDVIDAALLRLREMFAFNRDRQLGTADDASGAWVRWAGNLGELRDPDLQNAPMGRARFQIDIVR